MTPFLKAKLIALAVFAVASGGFTVHHFMYVAPERACVAQGHWWAAKWRRCAAPIAVLNLPGLSEAAAAAAGSAPAPQRP